MIPPISNFIQPPINDRIQEIIADLSKKYLGYLTNKQININILNAIKSQVLYELQNLGLFKDEIEVDINHDAENHALDIKVYFKDPHLSWPTISHDNYMTHTITNLLSTIPKCRVCGMKFRNDHYVVTASKGNLSCNEAMIETILK